MIRPIDIQEKEFTRAVRGYKEDEVNAFLDDITIDLERLLDELRQTKEENSRLVEELERHRGSEGTVLETLEAAKTLMADISASAEKRADILLKNAELDAQLMQKEARDMADRITEESAARSRDHLISGQDTKICLNRSFRGSNLSAEKSFRSLVSMISMICRSRQLRVS